MRVKPAKASLTVLDPRTGQPIPRDGVEVSDHDLNFVRLMRDGDVVECEPPAEPAPAKAAKDGDAK